MPNLRYPWQQLRAQMGKMSERTNSYAMLLALNEIPGGSWRFATQHSWRIGSAREIVYDETRRAHELGLFIAYRCFRQSSSREVNLQVLPYASSTDARAMVPRVWSDLIRYKSSELTVKSERSFEEEVLYLSDTCLVEQQTSGITTNIKVVIGRVDNIVSTVACVALGEQWIWTDVKALAALQGGKILRRLEPPD